MKKVVLYCCVATQENDFVYGPNGMVITDLKAAVGEDITYVSFGGYLDDQKMAALVDASRDADVVLLDAWSHREQFNSMDDAERRVAEAAQRVMSANPRTVVFAELMEGVREVAVHHVPRVRSITGYNDAMVADVLKKIGRERILVVEDNEAHIKAAHDQLGDTYDLTVVSGFDQALDQLGATGWAAVLTDCMVPKGGDQMMSHEGAALAQRQGAMPYGPIIALHAIQRGIKRVGVLTAGNHHSDPFVFAFDGLRGFTTGDVKVVCSNNYMRGNVKDWKQLLDELQ